MRGWVGDQKVTQIVDAWMEYALEWIPRVFGVLVILSHREQGAQVLIL